ncbi:autotransporter outer membrane beta-barrel domain-containing protein [Adhaeretor mobilis]|uniref:PEP-CTERM protein-sorting domain-containing protein n=1 Tax=Adhaeretor mobilis TaxID=1930276 RepID=A0A517MTF9_9BACT|nr:hypothetical protein [Adhaeretor mobilis]QDS98175.1 hypothetical protein HG15A2_14480 [Adhaeretor mobilis]
MKISKLILAFSAMLALTTGIAQAYTVTHSTQGVLFSDDMEGAFSAEIGTWGTTNDGANLLSLSSMNTGPTVDGPAGAALGNDYLQLTRPSSPSKERFQEAIFTESVSTGTLDIAFSYWIDNRWGQVVTLDDAVGTNPGLTGNLASVLWGGPNTPGGGSDTVWSDWANAGLTDALLSPAQWNLFEMHVDLDVNTYQISVNGIPGAVVNTPSGTVSRIGIEFQDFDKTLFLDAPIEAPPIDPNRTWANTASGDWNVSTNWDVGVVPNANNVSAIFDSAVTSPATVYTNSAVTVESIQFGTLDDSGETQSYAIVGQGSVTLDSSANTPSINVIDGTHQFQAEVNLLDSTDVSVAAGASLAFNNALNLNANTLTKTGTGTLSINNQIGVGGGVVTALAGVIGGSGTISGDLNSDGATVAPGNSHGKLTVAGDYLQTDGSLEIEINGASADDISGNRQYDLLSVGGSLTLSGGSLDIVMGFLPTVGDTFDILDFSSIDLSGATLNLGTPGTDLLWDSSRLAVDGSLTVIASLLGDFDADSDVDGGDFLTWQRGLGTTYLASDLTKWQNNYGRVVGNSLSSATTVPEPISASLLIISLGALGLSDRRRK